MSAQEGKNAVRAMVVIVVMFGLVILGAGSFVGWKANGYFGRGVVVPLDSVVFKGDTVQVLAVSEVRDDNNYPKVVALIKLERKSDIHAVFWSVREEDKISPGETLDIVNTNPLHVGRILGYLTFPDSKKGN